jgi:thioredoxin 1
MFTTISDQDDPDSLIHSVKTLLIYFSTNECQVCKVLKPKVEELLSRDFPLIQPFFVDTEKFPRMAAHFSIFTVPTLIAFFDGKETIRKSRFIHLDELRLDLERPYNILFP